MTLRTLNYGNYGIFLIMGNAGFCPSAVLFPPKFPFLPEMLKQKALNPAAALKNPFMGVSFRDGIGFGRG